MADRGGIIVIKDSNNNKKIDSKDKIWLLTPDRFNRTYSLAEVTDKDQKNELIKDFKKDLVIPKEVKKASLKKADPKKLLAKLAEDSKKDINSIVSKIKSMKAPINNSSSNPYAIRGGHTFINKDGEYLGSFAFVGYEDPDGKPVNFEDKIGKKAVYIFFNKDETEPKFGKFPVSGRKGVRLGFYDFKEYKDHYIPKDSSPGPFFQLAREEEEFPPKLYQHNHSERKVKTGKEKTKILIYDEAKFLNNIKVKEQAEKSKVKKLY